MTDPDTRKLFVAGLSDGITELELRRIFEAAGASVEDVAVPRDRATGRARGFGFITLATEEQAEQVRGTLDGSYHDGRSISVRPFRGNRNAGPSPSRPPHGGYGGGGHGGGHGGGGYGGGGHGGGGYGGGGHGSGGYGSSSHGSGGYGSGGHGPSGHGPSGHGPGGHGPGGHAEGGRPPREGGDRDDRENTLFLANLPGDCREDELTEIFRDAGVGPVLKLHMPVDPDGRRRGFGFVTLRDGAAAKEAVPKLRERLLRGRPLTVDVARPRGERPSGGSGERPAVGGGGAWRSRPPPPRRDDAGGPPMRSFGGDAGAPPIERQTWDERRDPSKRKKEPAPKKKKVRAADRGHSRRENEGFRAPRARGLMDDWDDE